MIAGLRNCLLPFIIFSNLIEVGQNRGIGSFGYSLSEIEYNWTENPIEVVEFALADYILMNYVVTSRNISSKNGEQSIISVKFLFSRILGYYFLRTYFPLTIIVMYSWVSF